MMLIMRITGYSVACLLGTKSSLRCLFPVLHLRIGVSVNLLNYHNEEFLTTAVSVANPPVP